MVSMEVTFPQEIEPSFLAVRLKNNTKPPGCPLAVSPPPIQIFKLHLSSGLQHSTLDMCGYYFFAKMSVVPV